MQTQYARAPRRQSTRRSARAPSRNSDFVAFLHKVLDVLFSPITYPLRLLRDLITSPLTITVVLKAALLVVLVLSSAVVSVAAVGAFWWSWGTGGNVELEGWLVYGSRDHRTPHAVLAVEPDRFQEDLPYDVQVELELVRPSPGAEEMGNFMVTLELRSARAPDVSIIRAAQPSLPPPPLPSSLFTLPTFPTSLLPPCIIPWPFRSLCPGRLLGYSGTPGAKIKERRRRGTLLSPAKGNEVVLLTKEIAEGVVVAPGRGDAVGGAFVSIGREDAHPHEMSRYHREVRTTGWVVVRFIPHPTGLRWLLTSNPIPPLLILPPVSLTLTLSSALMGFLIMSCFFRPRRTAKAGSPSDDDTDDIKAETEAAAAAFASAAADDVLLGPNARTWAAIERRRRSTDVAAPGPSSKRTSPTPRPDHAIVTSVEPTPTETSGTGTGAAGSVTETEGAWDESESWQSSEE